MKLVKSEKKKKTKQNKKTWDSLCLANSISGKLGDVLKVIAVGERNCLWLQTLIAT